jgi:mono-ADP-ribosyltransferase sirtuin 6
MALVQLQRAGILKFIISQNIDGLHLRSGIPRSQLAELHGNCFRETCSSCGKEYFRDFEVETLGCKPTGRRCSDPECGAKLIDTIVDWEVIFSSQKLSVKHQHHQMFDSTWFLYNTLKFDVLLVGSKGHDILLLTEDSFLRLHFILWNIL